MDELTTTSYAILSLLGVKSWTTYELAQQMDRSVGRMWPRAASVVYEEPKRLARLGLATSTKTHTGKRASTVYSITDTGRTALAEWLASPGPADPRVEFEALLKVAFADNGSIESLRDNLAVISDYADDEVSYARQRLDEYAATGGPYPERLPVIALVARYYLDQAVALKRWIDWATEATANWTGVTPDTGAHTPESAFTLES